MEQHDIALAIEGILFASGEPVPVARLIEVLEIDELRMSGALGELEARYNGDGRGIRLLHVEESVQLCSAPEHAEIIRRTLEKRRTPQLSQAALEVLAIIAYFQPVTRAYVERVRGVDSTYTISLLINRGLIESCGTLQVPGRPTLFRTTKAFLRTFGLTEINQLPPLPEAEDESEAQIELRAAIVAIQEQEAAEAMAREAAQPEFTPESVIREISAEGEPSPADEAQLEQIGQLIQGETEPPAREEVITDAEAIPEESPGTEIETKTE